MTRSLQTADVPSAMVLMALFLLPQAPAAAQATRSPYAAHADVAVTGLLPDEVESLTAGKGMAQALPAEVNDFPGPLHVLEAADAGTLALEPSQRQEMQRIFDAMHDAAAAKGREILGAEAHLAKRFRHRHIDAATLKELVDGIARLRGELRTIHLQAHLETAALLTGEQIAVYRTIRGYDDPSGGHDHQHTH